MAKNKVFIKKVPELFFLENSRFFLKSSYFFGCIEKKEGIQVFLGNLNFSFLSGR